MRKLTPNQQSFCDYYLADPKRNGTNAYLEAYPGCSQKAAESGAARLMKKPHINAYIIKSLEERSHRTKVDADYIHYRLKDMDEMDVADILNDDGSAKPIKEWPKVWRLSLSGMEISEILDSEGDAIGVLRKLKWPEKLKILELLGKHVDVQAFKERLVIDEAPELSPWSSVKAGVDE